MNERIQALAEQAEIYAGDLIDQGADYNQYPRYYTEKFAELIVNQCAELTLDHKNDDYYAGWLDYRDEIKKHFGVQE